MEVSLNETDQRLLYTLYKQFFAISEGKNLRRFLNYRHWAENQEDGWKWETPAVGMSALSELDSKLSRRPHVNGILFSMSGFSKNIPEYVRDTFRAHVICLFGPTDITAIFEGKARLTDLLLKKMDAAVVRRTVIVDEV